MDFPVRYIFDTPGLANSLAFLDTARSMRMNSPLRFEGIFLYTSSFQGLR